LEEEHLEKLCALSRALAILVAIIAAFVAIPQATVVLLVLGGITAICNTPEENMRLYLVTVVLLLGARTLDAIPAIGMSLADIFTNIGVATLGFSIVAISIRIVLRIRNDWAT
jgi:hypothetical protein